MDRGLMERMEQFLIKLEMFGIGEGVESNYRRDLKRKEM